MFKQFLKFCSIMQYGLLIAATAVVIALQFVPNENAKTEFVFVIVCLSLYTAGFLAMATISVMNCVDVYEANRRAKGAVMTALVDSETTEVVSPKKEMFWAVVQAVFSLCAMLFVIATLIGYVVKYVAA